MESLDKLLQMIRSADVGQRVGALQFLAGPKSPVLPEAWGEILQQCEKDDDLAVRFWARKVRSRLDAKRADPGRATGSPEPDPHEAGSGRLQPGMTAPNGDLAQGKRSVSKTDAQSDEIPLEQAFRQLKSAGTGFAAIEHLHRLLERPDPEIEPLLRGYLQECKDPTQISFLTKHLPVRFPHESLVEELAPFLRHEDERVVANTLEGLRAIGSPGAVALAAQLVGHPHHRVRLNAARLLGAQDRSIVIGILEQMLAMPDHPHFRMAACQTIGELKAVEFLPRLTEMVDDSIVGEAAAQAVAILGAHLMQSSLVGAAPGFQQARRRNEILRAMIERLGSFAAPGEKTLSPHATLATSPAAAIGTREPGDRSGFELVVGQRSLCALIPRISRSQAEKTALERRSSAFGLLSRMLYRPQPDDIVLGYAEERYQPFWHLICKTKIDYSRSRDLVFPCDRTVVQVRLFERNLSPAGSQVSMNVIEHCREESQREVSVDAESGSRADYSRHLEASRRPLRETEELFSDEVIVVPARVKGSLVVREVLGELLKPVRAESIDAERIEVERLELIFRPVYAFEFTWGQKAAVLEIDGVTGEMQAGKAVRERVGEIFSEETLFEIGSEALGMLLPGGSLAAKLARAVVRK